MTIYSIGDSRIGRSIQLIFACLLAIPWVLAPQDTDAQGAVARSPQWAQTGVNASKTLLPAAGGPNIEVWYADQSDAIAFGAYGNPQPQINILGNVSDPDGVLELKYSLNGGSQKDVNFGASPSAALSAAGVAFDQGGMSNDPQDAPVSAAAASDNPRLESPGDFNIEIPTAQLSQNNTLVLSAKDDNGNTSSKTVFIQYTSGVVPLLPFSVDWTTVSGISDKTQVVDGWWTWNQPAGTIRSQVGYDRLVALGDLSWDEYEVEVPITINDIPKDNSGGIGLAVRWNGHFSESGEAPGKGWWDLGAYAYYRKRDASEGGPHLMLRTGRNITSGSTVTDYDVDYIQEGKTYTFKVRVEDDTSVAAANVNGSPGYFRFKVWETGQAEPIDWQLEIADGGEYRPESGSVVLVAYNADVSFGEVTVRSLNPVENFDVTVTTEGEGKVLLDSLQGPEFSGGTYASGTVLTLFAAPETDWVFAKWSGDVPVGKETEKSLTLTVDSDKSLVAQFTQEICRVTLTTNPEDSGDVAKEPAQDAFFCGADLTLTATSTPGWEFAGWSGNVPAGQENDNPLILSVDSDKSIVAEFAPADCRLTVNWIPLDGGLVAQNPSQQIFVCGDEAVLTANPATGWVFVGWEGDVPSGQETANPLSITVDSAKSIVAKFEQLYSLTTTVKGQGEISQDPDIDEFISGETVTLLASPIGGWVFSGWSGDVPAGEKNREIAVTMDRSKSITAEFSRLIYIPVVTTGK